MASPPGERAQAPSLGPGLARRSVLKRPMIEMPTYILPDKAETACLARGGACGYQALSFLINRSAKQACGGKQPSP